jgi:hypothetical protein
VRLLIRQSDPSAGDSTRSRASPAMWGFAECALKTVSAETTGFRTMSLHGACFMVHRDDGGEIRLKADRPGVSIGQNGCVTVHTFLIYENYFPLSMFIVRSWNPEPT